MKMIEVEGVSAVAVKRLAGESAEEGTR